MFDVNSLNSERCLPIQILTETGIGRVIGPLRKHENITISSISKQLVILSRKQLPKLCELFLFLFLFQVDQWKQKIKDLPVAPVVRTSENKPLSLLMDNSRNAGSEDVRLRAVRLLRDNIESGEDDDYKHNQSKEIEKKIFIENNQKIDKNYKAKVRQAVFKLKRLKNGEASHS